MSYAVDIYKDSIFSELLISISVEKEYFGRMDYFLREVVSQLEAKGIIQDRKNDDLHSLILVDAIGFQTEEPIKGEVTKKPAGSNEEIPIVTYFSKFSLGIPESLRK